MFDPATPPSGTRDLHDHADAAVGTFLAAYGSGDLGRPELASASED